MIDIQHPSYAGKLEQSTINTSAAAGNNTLAGAAVPAGEVWIVTSVIAFNTVNAMTYSTIYIVGAVTRYLGYLAAPARYAGNINTAVHVLEAGDYVGAIMAGCTLNDDIYLSISGYKMRL